MFKIFFLGEPVLPNRVR